MVFNIKLFCFLPIFVNNHFSMLNPAAHICVLLNISAVNSPIKSSLLPQNDASLLAAQCKGTILFQLLTQLHEVFTVLNLKHFSLSLQLFISVCLINICLTRLGRGGVVVSPHRGIPGPTRSQEICQQPAEGWFYSTHRQQNHLLRAVLLRLRRFKRL